MTIASSTNRNDYIGSGAVSNYAFTFKIFDETDLLVTTQIIASGIEATLALTTDYTVSGVGDIGGGSITLTTALPSTKKITIRRVRPLTQETDIRNQGEFFPEVHEDEFDILTMIDQQQQDELDRSVKLPETVAASGFDCSLPADIASNAGSAVIVNALGTGFALGTANSGTDSSRVAKVGDTMTGDLQMNAQKGIKLADADSSNSITLKAPSVVSVDYSVVFPAAVPTAQKVLKYDGTNYVWSDPNALTSAKAADYTVLDTDGILTLLMTTSNTDRVVTLPTAADNIHRILAIKKVDSGTGKVTLDGEGSETIDGALTKVLLQQYSRLVVQCDGTSWNILADGTIGENVRGVQASLTSVATTLVWQNITSIALDAGKWNLSGLAEFTLNGATCTASMLAISINSANTTTDHVEGDNVMGTLAPTSTARSSFTIADYRLPLTSPTTVYLKASATFSAGNPQFVGRIQATRIGA